jgi:hypothetical protein
VPAEIAFPDTLAKTRSGKIIRRLLKAQELGAMWEIFRHWNHRRGLLIVLRREVARLTEAGRPSIGGTLFVGLGKELCAFQDIFGSCSYAKIFGQIPPAHDARRVHQKFRGPSDVLPVHTGALVQQVVAANHFRFWVRQKRVRVSGFLAQRLGFFGRVHTNCYRPHSPPFQLMQTLLDTP